MRKYKLDVLATIDRLAALVAEVLPDIGAAAGRELIAAASLYANALWPITRPPAGLAALYEQDPAVARACVEFKPMLRRQIVLLIEGLTAGSLTVRLIDVGGRKGVY